MPGIFPISFDSLTVGCLLSGMLVISALLGASLRHASRLRATNATLAKLAGSDGLTGLANRRRLDENIEAECRRAMRHKRPISLLLLDVDRFKSFNDRYGHQAGDACLKQIAAAIGGMVTRAGDVAARYGGEEFALLLPETDEIGAARIAERACRAVEDLGIPHDGNLECGGVVTISIGCATSMLRPSGHPGSVLLAEADKLLYEAKRLGRNRFATAAAAASLPLSTSEEDRLRVVAEYRRDAVGERFESLDRIARMAAVLLGTQGAFVALLDRSEIAIVGQYGLDDEMGSVTHTLCTKALGGPSPMVVQDAAADPRFCGLLPQDGLRFLAAAPLLTPEAAQHLGALWIVDRSVRPPLDDDQRLLLVRLANLIVEDIAARRWHLADRAA